MQTVQPVLINFNMPAYLKESLDDLAAFKTVSRTSILNRLIENYIRVEHKYIEEDGRFRDMLSKAKEKNKRMARNSNIVKEYLNTKPIHKSITELDEEYSPPSIESFSNVASDDYNWEKDRWG